jgi:hypothetical protein
MKPQQFEDMLIADEPLSAEERKELEAQMQAYPELAVLQKNWNALKPHLEAAEMAVPEAGFAKRWRARWDAEAARIARRRAFLTAGLASAAALILLFSIAPPTLPTLVELKGFGLSALSSMIEWFAFLQIVVRVAGSLLSKMPPPWWSAIASLILILPLAWTALFRQLAFAKGTVK